MTPSPATVQMAARVMAGYAKHFHAGAFATPLARDIKPAELRWWQAEPGQATTAIVRRLDRPLRRRDWTGRPIIIDAGCLIAEHVARTPEGPLYDDMFDEVDYVFSHIEDEALTAVLRKAGFVVAATQITAASEIITCWGAVTGHGEDPADLVTAAAVEAPAIDEATRRETWVELAAVDSWHDDYPFYSDGSWGQANLRSFKPDDPLWGVKPSEMPQKWQREHPESLAWRCDWTVLSEQTPALRAIVEGITWITGLERVRLMRMEGRRGNVGHLARHSDVTDRNAGTRDGQIARFHLPLVTHPSITMSVWELDGRRHDLHLEAWRLYYLDARKPHAVTNPSGLDRTHLVIDAVVDDEVRKRIEATWDDADATHLYPT